MANGNESDVLGQLSDAMADAVERVGVSVVQVNGRQRQAASGVVFAEDLIVTADHVLEREEDLTIQTHDQRTLEAQFVGRDMSRDLAVLRVDGLGLEAATAATDARVGQLALAVGRPYSDGPMASLGIVSVIAGPLRTGRGAMLERYIRTDAIPYPGFSGGPLTRAGGEVLGILTTGLARGVTLAIPSSIAWDIAHAIATHGRIKRGYLGISSQPVRLPDTVRVEREQKSGLLIVHVEEGSPAARSGLLLGDVLLSLDGEPISDTSDLQVLLTGDRVGATVPTEVLRGGAVQMLQVEIGEKSA
ncbi:MAG: S1C family serine protease [Chloroflexota bacterium]|nr:S1C family serine protease [Chloroflexota bacterium]